MFLRSTRLIKTLRSNLRIGSLLVVKLINPLSSFHRLGIRYFCQSKQVQKISCMEKQAIVAYYTMQFIQNFKPQSYLSDSRTMRERIYCLEHLTTTLLQKAAKYHRKQIDADGNNSPQIFNNDESQISEAYRRLQLVGFERVDIDEVLKAYNIAQGFQIDLKVWKQKRFHEALLPNGKMVLFPNQGTGLIFQKITNSRCQLIISGDKGSGKSFAYLNYEYLAGFITDYRRYLYQNGKKHSQHLYSLVDENKFKKIKKLYYFTLKYIDHASFLQQVFQRQALFPNNYSQIVKEASQAQRYEYIRMYLMDLIVFLDLCCIESVCVADEANIYLSAFRSIAYDISEGKEKVQKYSTLFNCLQHIFTAFIYNSSQQIEAQLLNKLIQSVRDKKNQKFHNLVQDQSSRNTKGMHIRYNQFLSEKSGHILLYSLFWDQMCKQLSQLQLHKNLIIKSIFYKLFGISSKNQDTENPKPQLEILWWRIDIRHLNIRSVVSDSLVMQKLKNNLLLLRRQRDQSGKIYDSITQCFTELQREIIKNREYVFSSNISGYLQKSPNNVIKTFRFALLEHIAWTKQTQQSSDLNKCPEIEVDFSKIIQNFQKKHPTISFLQQVNDMSQLLGFGYPVKQQIKQTATLPNSQQKISIQDNPSSIEIQEKRQIYININVAIRQTESNSINYSFITKLKKIFENNLFKFNLCEIINFRNQIRLDYNTVLQYSETKKEGQQNS